MVIPGPLGTTLIRVVFENNDYVVSTRSYNCYLMMLLTNSRTHLFTECVLKKKQGQNKQRNTFWQERPYAEGCVHVVPLRMKCQHNTSLDDTFMLFYRYLSPHCNFCAAKNAAEFCSFCLKRLTFQDSWLCQEGHQGRLQPADSRNCCSETTFPHILRISKRLVCILITIPFVYIYSSNRNGRFLYWRWTTNYTSFEIIK